MIYPSFLKKDGCIVELGAIDLDIGNLDLITEFQLRKKVG